MSSELAVCASLFRIELKLNQGRGCDAERGRESRAAPTPTCAVECMRDGCLNVVEDIARWTIGQTDKQRDAHCISIGEC